MTEHSPPPPDDPAITPPADPAGDGPSSGWVPDLVAVRAELERYLPADRLPIPAAPVVPAPAVGVEVDGALMVPVDPPAGPRRRLLEPRPGTRRPIVPSWLRSWAALGVATRWAAGHFSYTAAYHAVRLPLYAGRLAIRAPRGAGRVAADAVGWLVDRDARPVIAAAIRQEDAGTYLRLARLHDTRTRTRAILAALVGLPALVLAVWWWVAAPSGVHLTVLGVVVAVLGVVGAPADQPLMSPAVVPTKVGRLTADVVTRALGALGIGEINRARREGGGITFPSPIMRDGPGWRAEVDLPYGVTVSDILERRERLASGLRRPSGCVWPEAGHDAHAGRLILWVGDQDMSQAPPPPWPLAKRGLVDMFAPLPFGTDPRGRPVSVSLVENNVLVGSLPGAGKTSAVRVLMLGCGLDPTCELWVFNRKGTADLDAAEKFAARYATGLDDATTEATLVALRDLRADIGRRAEAIRRLPKDLCPDGKVTRQIAGLRSQGLHPLVAIIDECQNLFSHPVYGKEAGELVTAVIKLGRALGVILILATQRPDAASLPAGVSSNVSIRFCLRVMGQVENDMILGTSMYKNGIQASTLRPSDKGIGYLVGATDEPMIVRAAYIDTPTAEQIADRARAARIAAGRLAEHAPREIAAAEPAALSLLDDILAVIPESENKVWSETVVTRLTELRPDLYGGWGPEQLAVVLKPYGIDTSQISRRIRGKVVNRRGIIRRDVADVVAERDRNRGLG
ncbi:DNA segregation ATPase FtsK/SpoIIIE, S-DNA-T family [Parafrankia irregularis]|uniref:DNA segregation ATPase FtsK/SpoIIIE, S-DNA-T family n=1 Tax=Parafrankia irregularis TaxID=795642 RepID=A0A0S4QYU0_9ACTN|nr:MULTISPECIES: cell division protein FtsK [Parafrankia]MBE3206422.1 cell division protein FtsK [Parafrankia sp. CH37]CUU60377.1 DNA segregation ATPase FtsK/SpoIIIE, S-DNA-T family [Parafrankia irregularis]